MITITSFQLFRSAMRITRHFYEDKATVRIKSLTYEHEYEFDYKNIGEISTSFLANSPQINFGFWMVLTCSITLSFFYGYIYANPVLLLIEQIIYIAGILLYTTGFRKISYISFADKNDTPLAFIKQTTKNQSLIYQVVDLMRKQSKDAHEINANNPFPDENHAFEHFNFDHSNLKKTTDRFYDKKIIGSQKSIFGDNAYLVLYSQLNGNIYRGKSGVDISDMVFSTAVFLLAAMNGLVLSFGLNYGMNALYFMYSLGAMVILSLMLKFIKREVIGLYDKNNNIAYWTYVNSNNKENIEKAIEFVKSKVSIEEII